MAATFYLEPVSTLDIDIFVGMTPLPGSILIDPSPIYNYLRDRGCIVQGEYIIIAGWPVQFLAPTNELVEEALQFALVANTQGEPVKTFSPEHLAAICLQTGRAKDKARLLQFIESSALDSDKMNSILTKHGLKARWDKFVTQFVEETE